jgi:uncharacterized protein YdeI (YjbR/CyaY-like superfamily)
MKPSYFKTSGDFRSWLEENHDRAKELLVGFHKKDSGKPSISYPEALDEALCYGWIDGVRKNINETSYSIRFTPRKPTSIWSQVNMKHVRRLTKLGRMKPAGLKVFEGRDKKRSKLYSFENRDKPLEAKFVRIFRANGKAWVHFQSQPPSYRRVVQWWIRSAKQEETRLKRLRLLIESCAKGEHLGQFVSKR